ncbi:hypothetical protein P885DRAFT_42438 [Corynascus similis CBS 632.67]
MKSFTSAALFLAALATASPVKRQDLDFVFQITGFTASKIHNSGFCNYDFDVGVPGLLNGTAHCRAYLDSGFSGATWLANVYEGAGNCDKAGITWTFNDPIPEGKDAHLNVTINGYKGLYTIPADQIIVNANDPENPFDEDVYYGGPKDFVITEFEEVEDKEE